MYQSSNFEDSPQHMSHVFGLQTFIDVVYGNIGDVKLANREVSSSIPDLSVSWGCLLMLSNTVDCKSEAEDWQRESSSITPLNAATGDSAARRSRELQIYAPLVCRNWGCPRSQSIGHHARCVDGIPLQLESADMLPRRIFRSQVCYLSTRSASGQL